MKMKPLKTICVLFLCIMLNLQIGESSYSKEYPELYEIFWPYFCFNHLLKDPNTCSSYTNDNQAFELEYNKYGYGEFYADPELIKKLEPYIHIIPNEGEKCDFYFCKGCNSPVIRTTLDLKSTLKKQETDEEESVIILGDDKAESDYWYTLGYRCLCLSRWVYIESYYPFPQLTDIERNVIENKWIRCNEPSIVSSYVDRECQTYFKFLIQHLRYCSENEGCSCFWPQTNLRTRRISNRVFKEMLGLFESNLIKKSYDTTYTRYLFQKNLSEVGHIRGMFIHCFFYSQYYQVLMDFISFLNAEGDAGGNEPFIIDDLYKTLRLIQKPFIDQYSLCISKHPHPKLFYERGMVYMHQGKSFDAFIDIQQALESASDKNALEEILTSDLYLQEGQIYEEMGEYDKAVEALTKAIVKDPHNKEAYFERAASYFEIGDFESALKDYLESGYKPTPIASNELKKLNMALGISIGIMQGGYDGAKEFIPSLLSTAYGLGKALWAFTEHPIQVSSDFIEALNQCVDFVKYNSPKEISKAIIPELKEVFENWHVYSDIEKGDRFGYIVGKYGVDIFAGTGTVKGVKYYQNLKRANRLLTLETMAASKASKKAVTEAALKFSSEECAFVISAESAPLEAEPLKGLTKVSDVSGWRVGDPVINRTAAGTVPKWGTVRQRYWKNQAELAKVNPNIISKYGEDNISRMEKGLAPQRVNRRTGQIESMELHHMPPQRKGGLFDFIEVWPEDHARLDPNRYIGT